MELKEDHRYEFVYSTDQEVSSDSLDAAASELDMMAGYRNTEMVQEGNKVKVRTTMEGPASSESLEYEIKAKIAFQYEGEDYFEANLTDVKEIESPSPVEDQRLWYAVGSALGVTAIMAGIASLTD